MEASVSHQLPQDDFSAATTGAGPAIAEPVSAAAPIIVVTTLLFIVISVYFCEGMLASRAGWSLSLRTLLEQFYISGINLVCLFCHIHHP